MAEEQKPQTAPAPSMSEAGFSINVKMIDSDGQEVMLTFRCPLASQSAKLLTHYSGEVKALLESGWSVSKGSSKPSNGGDTGNGSAPKCRIHGSAMKESRKPGSYFCPRKLADGNYCQEKGESN